MSRPFNPTAVVRGLPHHLLAAFCDAHRIPLPADALAPDADPRRVLAAAHALPEADRRRFDAALRDVHDLATEDGTRALVAEAAELGLELPAEFHALAGPAARGLWFLATHPRALITCRLVRT